MLRLYILRHAKSSWASPGRTDFNRGLNPRGIKDLPKIARCMKERSYLPDRIYSSSSARTRLTIEGIKGNIQGVDLPVEYADKLYSGSLENYLTVLQSHMDNSHSLMLVGHNPTCDSLATSLIGDGQARALDTISFKFPTGALAVIDIKADKWADIGGKTGYLRDFVLPREL